MLRERERENAREIKRDICIVSTHMTTELNPSYPELHLQSTWCWGLFRVGGAPGGDDLDFGGLWEGGATIRHND